MIGPYTHRLDPVLLDVGGVHLWWYGLGFALGFLELHLFLRRGGGQLPLGKSGVRVTAVEPVGQYAVRLVFDDGHDSGIYSWKYLRELGEFRDEYWAGYLEEAAAAQKAHAGA
jgi:hypothetical protein